MGDTEEAEKVQIGTGEASFSRSMRTFAALSEEGLKNDVLLCHAEIQDPNREGTWVPMAWVADGKQVVLDAYAMDGDKEPLIVKWDDEADFESELRLRAKHVYTWIQAQYYLELTGSCGPWKT